MGDGPDSRIPEDLSGLEIARIRALRDERVDVETGLSYLRRLVQGPLDVVRFEQQSRQDGEPVDAETLVESLPELLADPRTGNSPGRIPTTLAPKVIEPALEAEVEAVTGDRRLLDVAGLEPADLQELSELLADLEQRISERRRELHTEIDALQEEIARRYASGEASVDSLLGSDQG